MIPAELAAHAAQSTGARPKRSSATGATSRPTVIAVTNSEKPATPTQCRASYPSMSASESQ